MAPSSRRTPCWPGLKNTTLPGTSSHRANPCRTASARVLMAGCGTSFSMKPCSSASITAPHYLIRDRDRIYGSVVMRRLRAMGIRDRPITPASPFAERLIGSIRRECVDHIIVLGEAHLRRVLKSYADYYNSVRTHRSLNKDAPVSPPGSANRCDQFTRHPGRTSSPLRPRLSCRYTQGAGWRMHPHRSIPTAGWRPDRALKIERGLRKLPRQIKRNRGSDRLRREK
jgi:hypothetical protein